jgi:thymidylate synthase ThyX
MTEPSAKVILDSVSPRGDRLTTVEAVMHRFVLAELNTHRVFSRNSASSRAIPVKKQLQRVIDEPAMPLVWPVEQSGMQGGQEMSPDAQKRAEELWLEARDHAVSVASALTNAFRAPEGGLIEPLHKSLVNRLLEPFMWHTCIISSTEWSNFFGLRCNPMAMPEIRAVAEAIRDAREASTPQELDYGGWHMPYLRAEDHIMENDLTLPKISAARCARVSYLTHDGVRDPDKDVELYERLISANPPHSSPLEHVATPSEPHWFDNPGNFTGWYQLRHKVGK